MKTKVIAFRVTQEEYDALAFLANRSNTKISELVASAMASTIKMGAGGLQAERKRLEAKAKRDAKKAAANGAQ